MRKELVELELDVFELQLGMYVIRLDRPWEETNFLFQGFTIQSQDDIQALQAQCRRVVIEGKVETTFGKPEKFPFISFVKRSAQPDSVNHQNSAYTYKSSPQRSGKRVTYINKVDVSTEIPRATIRYADAKSVACGIMDGLRVGRALDINRAREVVNKCVDSILRNDEALLLLTRLKNKDEYTAEHSLNVSIIAATFGKRLGLLEEEVRLLGLCGLLHDIGKTKVPSHILQKPTALTHDEYEVVKNHADWGRDLLLAQAGVPPATIDVAYNHHERLDGHGYPRGLVAEKIPYFAKIIAIVDTYDAITSNRAYDTNRTSMDALETIHRFRGKQFDSDLALEFVMMIGIYSPGSIVEMKTGEICIVVASNPKNRRKPKLLMVRDADKQPLAYNELLNGNFKTWNAGDESFAIVRELPDGAHGVFIQRFIEDGLTLAYFNSSTTDAVQQA